MEPAFTPRAVDDIAWEPWSHGIRFGGTVRRLTPKAADARIGMLIEELAPGKQSAPLHWHTDEEEHVWFLAGRATLRLGDARHAVAAGDYVYFPAGQALGHCIVNDSDAPCRYLVVGERSKNDVCVYPDSGKVFIDGAIDTILSLSQPLDYWDGERADEPLPASRPA